MHGNVRIPTPNSTYTKPPTCIHIRMATNTRRGYTAPLLQYLEQWPKTNKTGKQPEFRQCILAVSCSFVLSIETAEIRNVINEERGHNTILCPSDPRSTKKLDPFLFISQIVVHKRNGFQNDACSPFLFTRPCYNFLVQVGGHSLGSIAIVIVTHNYANL